MTIAPENPTGIETTAGERLAALEQQHGVKFTFDYTAGEVEVDGLDFAVKAALKDFLPHRDEYVAAIHERQPPPPPARVKVRLSAKVPSLAVQREHYVQWYRQKPHYYWPREDQIDKMFSLLSEGDEILPDFAHSFSVRKPDGRLIQIDRKGKVTPPSVYSPHLPRVIEPED